MGHILRWKVTFFLNAIIATPHISMAYFFFQTTLRTQLVQKTWDGIKNSDQVKDKRDTNPMKRQQK